MHYANESSQAPLGCLLVSYFIIHISVVHLSVQQYLYLFWYAVGAGLGFYLFFCQVNMVKSTHVHHLSAAALTLELSLKFGFVCQHVDFTTLND